MTRTKTPRCTIPDCDKAQEGRSMVCKGHVHRKGYCKCRRCTKPAAGNDFTSTASVTLPPMPWEAMT